MILSAAGLEFLKAQETCDLDPYEDPPGSGIYSVGWGHSRWTGGRITQATADWLLVEDTRFAVSCVNSSVHVPLSQAQFDALVDFTYNEGAGALLGSTLLKRLNAGDYAGAADEFLRWDKVEAGGSLQPSEGLAQRRERERAMFLTQQEGES